MWNCKEAGESEIMDYVLEPMQAHLSSHPRMTKLAAGMRCAANELTKSRVRSSAPNVRSRALVLTWQHQNHRFLIFIVVFSLVNTHWEAPLIAYFRSRVVLELFGRFSFVSYSCLCF